MAFSSPTESGLGPGTGLSAAFTVDRASAAALRRTTGTGTTGTCGTGAASGAERLGGSRAGQLPALE